MHNNYHLPLKYFHTFNNGLKISPPLFYIKKIIISLYHIVKSTLIYLFKLKKSLPQGLMKRRMKP